MACQASSRRVSRCDWRRRVRLPARDSACELDASGRWLVVRRFVTAEEREALYRKALGHLHRRELPPNPSGPNRFFAKVDNAPDIYVDDLLRRLTRRCERCLALQGAVPEDLALGRVCVSGT